jgi:hypothetical protein
MQFLVVLVLNSFLGTIAARRCLSQTVPTAGDPWSPEQANNEPTQQNPGHARIFGFPIEPVGSLTICSLAVLPASRATGGIIGFSALQRILLQMDCTPDHRGIPLE